MWRTTARLTWGIVMISAASLAYEIVLTRLFAVQQFYHFAFVVISIATMGFAASGLLLSIRRVQTAPYLLALAFSLTVLLAYIIINALPFDSYSIAWDPQQWWILLLYFVVSGAPFVAAGWTIGSALDAAGTAAYRPYAANMIGAAIGCPLALISVDLLGGEGAIGLILALGFTASLVLGPSRTYLLGAASAALLAIISFTIPLETLRLTLSPYKPLSAARLASGAQLTLTEWGPSARLDVVERPGLRSFPGLSLNASITLPEQAGVYVDGEGPLPITHLPPDDPAAAEIGSRLPASIAYGLRPSSNALLLDWGAGTPATFALALSDGEIWLPNDQPILTQLLRSSYSDYSYNLLSHPEVNVLGRASRSALSRADRSYDVVEFALSDPFRPVTSGAFSLGEDYLLTVNAFTDAWNRLDADGIMVITRWIGTPPSDSARAWNTLLTALRQASVEDLRSRIIAFRGIRTATMLVSPQPFSDSELAEVRAFLERNAFDALILPGLQSSEINRFNRLPEPVYHELYEALLEDPDAAKNYSFRLEAPFDDKPYFNHFFRWGQTPEILASLGLFWQPFGGSGYFVLLVLMALMILLAILLVAISLFFSWRDRSLARPDFISLLYFAGLGGGYLLVEIPLIQQFTLLLDHPAESLAGVLFLILFGSGIGSWLSPRLKLRRALLALLGYLLLTVLIVSPLTHSLLPAPEWVRWLAMGALLLPLGILMGVPFASGLRDLELEHPGWIPWAWAVNGAFSGISGVAAAIISLDAGFQATLLAGGTAYLLAFAANAAHSIRGGKT